MRKDFGAKPFLYPQPVLMLATYGEDGTPDVMNAAWGGIADMKRVAMYLSASHKTVKNILARKAFTVSMADADHVTECDYLGIVSANQVPDKVARAGFHVTKSAHVDAPLVDELPLALECRFVSFDEESELLVGEIVNVSADERILLRPGCAPSPATWRTAPTWCWGRRWATPSRTERSSSERMRRFGEAVRAAAFPLEWCLPACYNKENRCSIRRRYHGGFAGGAE